MMNWTWAKLLSGTLALTCLAVVGCSEDPSSGAAPSESGPSVAEPAAPADAGAPAADAAGEISAILPDSTDWTIGVLTAPSTLDGTLPPVPVLTALRTGMHPEYERLTIELEGAAGFPSYDIEYVDRPLHDCGSGEPTYPVGDAWLEVRLYPAAAHTEEGQPTLGPRDLAVEQPVLRRIYRTCDFEAVVTHVLALAEPNPFRVMRLADPPRLVVDVRR